MTNFQTWNAPPHAFAPLPAIRMGSTQAFPGQRFCVNFRYHPNNHDLNWAAALETSTTHIVSNLQNELPPHQVLEAAKNAYTQAIGKMNRRDKADFGVLRLRSDAIDMSISRDAHWLQLQRRLKQLFLKAAKTGRLQNTTPARISSTDPFLLSPVLRNEPLMGSDDLAVYIDKQLVIPILPATATSPPASLIIRPVVNRNQQLVLIWSLPPAEQSTLDALSEKVAQTLSLKPLPKTPETLSLILARVADFHWTMACTMPYQRGSAGIADMVTKIMLDQLEVETPLWKEGLSPDFEAFLTPDKTLYIQHYPTLFQEPFRFKSTAKRPLPPPAFDGDSPKPSPTPGWIG